MMNVVIPSSECSSGCESGWTLYLEHSTKTFSNSFRKRSFDENEKQELQKMAKFEDLVDNNRDGYLYGDEQEEEDEEEEDLSMVSDASSGPPHFDNDDNIDEEEEDNDDLLRKQCMKSYANESHYCVNNMADDFALDDTASSQVFTSKKIGGIHVQNHQNASFERLIGYSSQGYSATHFQVGLNSSKSRRYQDLGQGFSSSNKYCIKQKLGGKFGE